MTSVGEVTPDTDPELTYSDRYVFRLVDEDAPLSRQALLAKTDAPAVTVDRALDRLEKAGYIAKTRKNGDLRQVVITVTTMHTSNPREN